MVDGGSRQKKKGHHHPTHKLYDILFGVVPHNALLFLHHHFTFICSENCLLFILVKHVISYDNSKWRAGDFIVHKLFKRCTYRSTHSTQCCRLISLRCICLWCLCFSQMFSIYNGRLFHNKMNVPYYKIWPNVRQAFSHISHNRLISLTEN